MKLWCLFQILTATPLGKAGRQGCLKNVLDVWSCTCLRERLLDAGQKCFPNGMWLGRKESAGGLGRGKQDTDLELNSHTQGLDLRARPPGLKWCQLGGKAGVAQLSLQCSSAGLN